jgi:hypothetical protein
LFKIQELECSSLAWLDQANISRPPALLLSSAAILSFRPSNRRTRRNSRLTSHFHQAIWCFSGHRHCPCNATRANKSLEWALCEILGDRPQDIEDIYMEEDNNKLVSMPVGARPSIKEIRTANSTWYSIAERKSCDGFGGMGAPPSRHTRT